jgi:diguanylate cyclase (GGDEF)-like protein
VAEIDNYLLLRNLKTLSSTDMLTGVLNRNEMNNRVDAISEGRESVELPGGVVFADLNGLKVVNDEQGHPAGDQLLKDGASILVEVFGAESVFRAGGDEYVAIVGGITEEGLREKVAAVREVSKRYGNVSFALGCCAFERNEDLRLALHVADERMYANKRAMKAERVD